MVLLKTYLETTVGEHAAHPYLRLSQLLDTLGVDAHHRQLESLFALQDTYTESLFLAEIQYSLLETAVGILKPSGLWVDCEDLSIVADILDAIVQFKAMYSDPIVESILEDDISPEECFAEIIQYVVGNPSKTIEDYLDAFSQVSQEWIDFLRNLDKADNTVQDTPSDIRETVDADVQLQALKASIKQRVRKLIEASNTSLQRCPFFQYMTAEDAPPLGMAFDTYTQACYESLVELPPAQWTNGLVLCAIVSNEDPKAYLEKIGTLLNELTDDSKIIIAVNAQVQRLLGKILT